MAKKDDKQPPAEARGKPLLNRRTFLYTAATAAAGAGVATYMLSGRSEEQQDSRYLSAEEAKNLYLQLKQQVKEKLSKARAQQKPLRIVMLEGHGSTNALAYNVMMMHIAKDLGIKKLLFEYSEYDMDTLRDPAKAARYQFPHPETGRHFQTLFDTAAELGMDSRGIDNRWNTAAEYAEDKRRIMSRELYTLLSQKYTVNNYSLTITAHPEDQFLERARFSLSGDFSPPIDTSPGSAGSRELGEYIEEAERITNDIMRAERDRAMHEIIKNSDSCMIIMGKNHGIHHLPLLRKAGEVDIAFSPSNREVDAEYMKLSTVSDAQRRALGWANNPENAIQQTGKDFNPKDLPVFLKTVIERANSKGAYR